MTTLSPALRELGAASLHESGATPLPPRIRPLDPAWRICGRAFTVDLTPGHNIWLHRALYAAQPGDVLVAAADTDIEYGYWGDILAHAAAERGLAGLVIDGSVRDSTDLKSIGFPVFARGLCVRGTGKDATSGGFDVSIQLGSTTVHPGDIIVGDADGVVAIDAGQVKAVVERALQRERSEEKIRTRIAAGETTLDIYGLS
ncbi:4-hydroxy-4-methyl-2-oxoglutarate aldolase [Rhodococcus sp. ACS1]|uniref:RraA family protein n=1 Tax=Rhodococcus TaxID=1827 RepID=UPI000BB161F1|nr:MULTISPECIES: 4-hydroxy-4-methyl-2-oxoglutarate aldolase [Rhodococcus]PBC50006.1 4-hydroxy-4-methyl-2-oxoglutarate aldolase [Rhodococcus sp. ACS1]QSE80747.1 4-hydroxy-4-methyl-2-oxoglutarate aldolase [Rhodococcus koreensis]